MKKTTKLLKMTVSVIMILALTLTGCGKATAPTSDTIQWFNNTHAVLTVLNQRDYRVYGGDSPNIAEKTIAKALLENTWDVTDRASADESLQWLLEEGHRIPLAEELAYLAEIGLADVSEDQRAEAILSSFDLDEQQAEQYAEWFSLYEQHGENAAAAWDYSRAMWLLSYYYLADYYTLEESLDQSLALAETIQTTFIRGTASWKATSPGMNTGRKRAATNAAISTKT